MNAQETPVHGILSLVTLRLAGGAKAGLGQAPIGPTA